MESIHEITTKLALDLIDLMEFFLDLRQVNINEVADKIPPYYTQCIPLLLILLVFVFDILK